MSTGEIPSNRTSFSVHSRDSVLIQGVDAEVRATPVLELFRQTKEVTRSGVGAFNQYVGGSYEQVSKHQMMSRLKEKTNPTKTGVSYETVSSITEEAETKTEPSQTLSSIHEISANEKRTEIQQHEYYMGRYRVEAPKSGLLFKDEILPPIYLPTKYEVDMIEPPKERRKLKSENDHKKREFVYCRYAYFLESYQKEHNTNLNHYDGLQFDSNFECGNLFSVEYLSKSKEGEDRGIKVKEEMNIEGSQDEEEEYDLFLDSDPIYSIDDDDFRATNNAVNNADLLKIEKKFFLKQVKEYDELHSRPSSNHWFFFRFTNTKRNQRYRFHIHNLSKSDYNLYQQGMKPLFLSQHHHQHQVGWRRVGQDLTFEPCSQKRMWPTIQGPMIFNDISTNPSYPQSQATATSEQFYTLSFSFTSESFNDTVYIASHPLYTYSQLQVMLSSLLTRNQIKPHLQVHRICRTLAGNNCDLVVITQNGSLVRDNELTEELDQVYRNYHAPSATSNVPVPQSSYNLRELLDPKAHVVPLHTSNEHTGTDSVEEVMKSKLETLEYESTETTGGGGSTVGKSLPKYLQKLQVSLEANYEITTKKKIGKNRKPAVILLSRIHAYETNSNWIMEGIIKFLLSDNEYTEKLRNSFTFYIFPMINIDGVVNGCNKLSLCGDDYEHCWTSPSSILHPEIHRIKSIIHRIYQTTSIACIFQLRAHAPRDGIYFHSSIPTSPAPIYLPESSDTIRTSATVTSSRNKNLEADEVIPTVNELYNATANRSVLLSIKHCSLHPPREFKNSLRALVKQEYKRIPIAASIHASQLRGPPSTIYHRSHLRPLDYAKFGGEFCLALGDVLRAFEDYSSTKITSIRDSLRVGSTDYDDATRRSKASPPRRGSINRASIAITAGNTRASMRSSIKSPSKIIDAIADVAQRFNEAEEDEEKNNNSRSASPVKTNYHYSTISSYYIGDVDIIDESSLTQRELQDRENYNERLAEEKIEVETSRIRLDRIEQYNERIWELHHDYSSSDEETEDQKRKSNNNQKGLKEEVNKEDDVILTKDDLEVIEYRYSELQKQFDLSLQRSLSKFFRRAEVIGFPKSFFMINTENTEKDYLIHISSSTFTSIAVSFLNQAQVATPYLEVLEKKRIMKEQLDNINKKNLQQSITKKFENNYDDLLFDLMDATDLQDQHSHQRKHKKTIIHNEDEEGSLKGRKRGGTIRKKGRTTTVRGKGKGGDFASHESSLISGESSLSSAGEEIYDLRQAKLGAELFKLVNGGQKDTMVQALITRKKFDLSFTRVKEGEDEEEEYDVEKNVELQRKIQELRELYAAKAAAEAATLASSSSAKANVKPLTEEEKDQLIIKQLIEENYLPPAFLQIIQTNSSEKEKNSDKPSIRTIPASFILQAITVPPPFMQKTDDSSTLPQKKNRNQTVIDSLQTPILPSAMVGQTREKTKQKGDENQINNEGRKNSLGYDVDNVLETISRTNTAVAKEGIHPDAKPLVYGDTLPGTSEAGLVGGFDVEGKEEAKLKFVKVDKGEDDGEDEASDEDDNEDKQRRARMIISDEIDEFEANPRRHIEIIREYLMINKGKKPSKDMSDAYNHEMTKEEAYQQFTKELGFQYEYVFGERGIYSSEKQKQKEKNDKANTKTRTVRKKHQSPPKPYFSPESSVTSSLADRPITDMTINNTFYLRNPLFHYYDEIIQQLLERKIVPEEYIHLYAKQIFQSLSSKNQQLFSPRKFIKYPQTTTSKSDENQLSPDRRTGRERERGTSQRKYKKTEENIFVGERMDDSSFSPERSMSGSPHSRRSPSPPLQPQIPANSYATSTTSTLRTKEKRDRSPQRLIPEDPIERKQRVDERFQQLMRLQKEKKEAERAVLSSIAKINNNNEDGEKTIPIPAWLSSNMKRKVMNIILEKQRAKSLLNGDDKTPTQSSWLSGYSQVLQRSVLAEASTTLSTSKRFEDSKIIISPDASNLQHPENEERNTEEATIDETKEVLQQQQLMDDELNPSEEEGFTEPTTQRTMTSAPFNAVSPEFKPRQQSPLTEVVVLKPAVTIQFSANIIPQCENGSSHHHHHDHRHKEKDKARRERLSSPKRTSPTHFYSKDYEIPSDVDLAIVANQPVQKKEKEVEVEDKSVVHVRFDSKSIEDHLQANTRSSISDVKPQRSVESTSVTSLSKPTPERVSVVTLAIPTIPTKSLYEYVPSDSSDFTSPASPSRKTQQMLQSLSLSRATDESFSLPNSRQEPRQKLGLAVESLATTSINRFPSNDSNQSGSNYRSLYEKKLSKMKDSFDFDEDKVPRNQLIVNSPGATTNGDTAIENSSLIGKRLFSVKPPKNPKPSTIRSPMHRKQHEVLNDLGEGSVEIYTDSKTIVRIHTPKTRRSNQSEEGEIATEDNDNATTSSANVSMQTPN